MKSETTGMAQPGWIEKLKTRWKVKNAFQVFLILLVFACTGTTVLLLKKPFFHIAFPEGVPTWAKITYWICILPIYNVILLVYGFIFGQFKFFWEFEKRMFRRMTGRK
jgi:hypothetical protein